MLGRHLERNAKIADDTRRARGRGADLQPIVAVGNALEQKEAVEIGAGDAGDLARAVDQFEIDTLEAEPSTLDQGAFDVAAADQRDFDVSGHARPWHDDL